MPPDPYKYFRVEARELADGLAKALLDLEKGDAQPDLVARVLRLAHTLKGAARVVKQREIGDHAHALEELLSPLRDGGAVGRPTVDGALAHVDAIQAQLATLAPAEEGAAKPETEAAAPAARADVEEMQRLLEGIAETQVQVGALRRQLDGLDELRRLAELLHAMVVPATGAAAFVEELQARAAVLARGFGRDLDVVDRELAQVREDAERLKLLPASAMFGTLERTARDAAAATSTKVSFETRGGDVRLDAVVLGAIQQALVQAVRNAVAHGIEPPAERTARGKPAAGRVVVEVSRRGSRVAVACRDDGRGVDVAAVRRAVERRGGARGAVGGDAHGVDALLATLLRGGITTSGTVTAVSGRGVGLDVVRETAQRLGGEVSMRTDAGAGTTLELVMPVGVAAIDALVVEAGGRKAALPVESVRGARRVGTLDVARAGSSASVVVDGEVVPFAPLARLLGAEVDDAARAWSVVLLADGELHAAVGVDRMLGTQNVVLRPAPRLALASALVAGAWLDALGNPQIVLDPAQVVARARQERGIEARTAAPRLPILVVDDSLTTRMLEQSILESAGYRVELAASAEEGLEKARVTGYALFLVDVEMPGMDGFTFVERTRADPVLRNVPAMLVTSRASPEDRRRGESAGASGYVVKGEFDQNRLLARIRELVG